MVRSIADFPRKGIEFRQIRDIAQQHGGLSLCTSLMMKSHMTGGRSGVGAVVGCDAGGFIFTSALAARVDVPLVPPPTWSVGKSQSHISSSIANSKKGSAIEIGRGVLPRGASVVVVVVVLDDVLATGATLCAVLELLGKAGTEAENIGVLFVAEFPAHLGRKRLVTRGLQSLLVLDGK